jgi:RHH-type proline utilization regulon transcriptional repressor/proline dehydrogenase/delta 1-pyrroline-5-carboxylate dehydrogenase
VPTGDRSAPPSCPRRPAAGGAAARFCGLLAAEAGKTLGDAVAEVREAVDFCRYYAQQAAEKLQPIALPGPTGESNELRLHGRGVFVCISPWNFPLAIFAGQVVAALVAGNAVAAKPAEQTPGVAASLHRPAARVRRAGRRRAAAARPGRDGGRAAGGRPAHRRRVLHRQHRGGAG